MLLLILKSQTDEGFGQNVLRICFFESLYLPHYILRINLREYIYIYLHIVDINSLRISGIYIFYYEFISCF